MRAWRALVTALAALSAAGAARAQPVTSPGPDTVTVSIYRAPDRDPDEALDLDLLEGYALITETRSVMIPAGRAVIRFEGVAGGILPESAIVTGLPQGVREKNLDADLLNPRSLYARSYGRPVTIRHTGADGKEVEERAIIRSGPDGAAIFETARGFIAADCRSGSDEIVYDAVPAGLSAKPTLSIETESLREGRVTITLSYLAWGFDWQANYVATMRPDGRSADLFAWVTLANSDVTGFADAQAMVIAGKPNRENNDRPEPLGEQDGQLTFRCFSHSRDNIVAYDMGYAPPAPAPPAMAARGEEIVVTGMRVRKAQMATQEDLGDLKLYRLPVRTNVASMSQKQVAMLDRESVPVAVVYRSRISDSWLEGDSPRMLLRAENKKEKGLGLPLPQGPVAVFEPSGARQLLVGEGAIADKAVGEEVEIEFADATQVQVVLEETGRGENWTEHVLTVSNASPFAVHYEAELAVSDTYRRAKTSARLGRRRGQDIWAVTVPANGTATLRYRLTEAD